MLQGNAGLILLLLIASCMTFTMGFYTYKFTRGKTGVKAYAFLMFASTFYAFGYGMELASETLDGDNILAANTVYRRSSAASPLDSNDAAVCRAGALLESKSLHLFIPPAGYNICIVLHK